MTNKSIKKKIKKMMMIVQVMVMKVRDKIAKLKRIRWILKMNLRNRIVKGGGTMIS